MLMASITGAIDSPTADAVQEAINAARAGGYDALVLRLDTPGGALGATLTITEAIANSPVPVIGYVAPTGAIAASAGTIILESTDLAAMTPFTTIGSVHPVEITPTGVVPVNDSKIINFVVANLHDRLAQNHRNTSLASAFVVDNLNLNATQALNHGAIEIVAPSIGDLLRAADNRTLPFKGAVLHTAGARVDDFTPSLRTQALALLSNTLIASLLLTIGVFAIIFGIQAPGHGAEIAGIILVILGVIGLGFSVSPAAAALIVLGVVLLILELKKGGHGFFGISGIVAILLGAFFLAQVGPFVTPSYQAFVLATVLAPTGVFGAFILFAVYKVAEVKRRRPVIGADMVGEEAKTVDPLAPGKTGYVLYRGEMWSATAGETIPAGQPVTIAHREGLTLTVRPRTAEEGKAQPATTTAAAPGFFARLRSKFPWRRG